MDPIAQYNLERWQALAHANALFTRPALNLDAVSAKEKVDPEGRLGTLAGRRVLCLASGGGQQSVAFALLGAKVTVVDLSPEQLDRDRQAAAHYSLDIATVQADMRGLSSLEERAYDLVWQPYSINFVPSVSAVFEEVARRLRSGGQYYFAFANPLTIGLTPRDWTANGYPLRDPYIDGAKLLCADADWVHTSSGAIPPPQEFRHTLATVFNALVEHGFLLSHFSDSTDIHPDPNAQPGAWDHFTSIAPPWFNVWTRYLPGASI